MNFPSSVTVTGQVVDLSRLGDTQKTAYITLAKEIVRIFSASGKLRMIFGFAGPSGSGKSTLTAILKELLKSASFRTEQLSIDAYHYQSAELQAKELLDRKGRYDTYRVEDLLRGLSQFKNEAGVSFPEYSRETHEPIENGSSSWKQKESGVLLIEGLWLLYKEGPWAKVADALDVSYFIDEDRSKARERTLARHVRGGRTQSDAESFYENSDQKNAVAVQNTRACADHILKFS